MLKIKPKRLFVDLDLASLAGNSPFLRLFLDNLSVNDRSPLTIRNYGTAVRHFLGYFDNAEPGTLTPDQLTRFFLDEAKCRSAATVNLTKAAVHSFYEYLLQTGKVASDPSRFIKHAKIVRKAPKVLSETEIESFLEGLHDAIGNPPKPRAMRDWFINYMIYNFGLRLAEVIGLNMADLKKRTFLQIIGKGTKLRELPLLAEDRAAVLEYLDWRERQRAKDVDALLINQSGRRIGHSGVQRSLKACLRAGGFDEGLTPHSLRHSVATHMANKGIPAHVIKSFLGHSSLRTTDIYVHSEAKQLRSARETLRSRDSVV